MKLAIWCFGVLLTLTLCTYIDEWSFEAARSYATGTLVVLALIGINLPNE